jgi:hypothetical protein
VNQGCLLALAMCLMAKATNVSGHVAALDSQRDPVRLEAAATAIAESGDASAIHKLAARLGQRSFLRRLDPGQPEQSDGEHLLRIFSALTEHPNAATEALCVGLARNAEFVSVSWRLNPLLNALAAVRPTSAEAAAIFRETSHAGYVEVNGPLLARNGSPNALAVLEEIFADEGLDVDERIDVAHRSLLAVRTNVAVAEMCARLLARRLDSSRVRLAIAESLFDYQPKPWFGVAMDQPVPPDWKLAGEPARAALRSLGNALLGQADVPASLRAAIRTTLAKLR